MSNQCKCPKGWRFLKIGEVIQKGDKFWLDLYNFNGSGKIKGWIARNSAINDKQATGFCPTIRRKLPGTGMKFNKTTITKILIAIQDNDGAGMLAANAIATKAIEDLGLRRLHQKLTKNPDSAYKLQK